MTKRTAEKILGSIAGLIIILKGVFSPLFSFVSGYFISREDKPTTEYNQGYQLPVSELGETRIASASIESENPVEKSFDFTGVPGARISTVSASSIVTGLNIGIMPDIIDFD